MPYIKKSQIPILIVFAALVGYYAVHFYSVRNIEFLFYVGIVTFFWLLILFTNRIVKYPDPILWGLTFWAFLHLSGGGLYFNGHRLYSLMIVRLSQTYPIFRFDQLVHMIGFGITTLLMWHLLKPLLSEKVKHHRIALSIVVVMAGLGIGALNEIVEFMATVFIANTGVGGYVNTMLDMVSNLIGALIAIGYIRLREEKLHRID